MKYTRRIFEKNSKVCLGTRFMAMLIMILTVLTGVVVKPVKVEAASNWPTINSSNQCEFVANWTINVYTSSSLAQRGSSSPYKAYNSYVDPGDVCYILSDLSKSSILISYPTGSGRKQGWVHRSDVIDGVSNPIECVTSKAKVTTYKYAVYTNYGNTAVGDTVYNLGGRGTQGTMIIYYAPSGSRHWKLGCVYNSDYNKIKGSNSNSYISDSALAGAASKYSISTSSNAYAALRLINTKYASKLSDSEKRGTLVFMFEGVGNNSSTSKRANAMCVVIKNGSIVYINKNSSSLPDYPFNPAKNGGDPMPTLKSGIYTFKTVNHRSSYAALNVTGANVVRFKSASSWYSSTSTAINIHRKSSDSNASSSASWVNSAGCQLVGATGTAATSEYARFIQAVGIVGSSASATAKYSNSVSGKYIVDRTFAHDYMRAIGYSESAIQAIG